MTPIDNIADAGPSLTDEMRAELHAAAAAAASWDVTLRPANLGPFPHRVAAARAAILRLEKQLTQLPSSPSASPRRIIGLLDLRANPRVVRSAITGVAPKPRDNEILPRVVTGSRHEEPRVAALCESYLRATKYRADSESFTVYVEALQAHEPLTLLEIWSIPVYLRFCMVERILAEADRALREQSDEADESVQRMFASLRAIGNIDWLSVLEPLILFDALLRQDPTGTYAAMDFDSREAYRKRIALLARHSDFTEIQVAEFALELARNAGTRNYQDPRIRQRCTHIGYFLLSDGFKLLADRVNFHAPLSHRIRTSIRANVALVEDDAHGVRITPHPD